MRELLAGGASRDITPDSGLLQYNGPLLEPGDGAPLTVNALCVQCGETAAALVSVDTLFVDRAQVLQMREECELATGIPGANVCIAATHTHSSPPLGATFLAGEAADPLYVDSVIFAVREAVLAAHESQRPASLYAGSCPTPGIEHCRRRLRPDGQARVGASSVGHPEWRTETTPDPTLTWALLEDERAEPIAVMFAWPIHNNACTGRIYHADLFGRAAEALRDRLGSDVTTVTFAAPCGDIAWYDTSEPDFDRGDDFARRAAAVLADNVLEARAAARPIDLTELRVASDVQIIPDRDWADCTWCHDDCRGDSEVVRQRMRERYDPENEAVRKRGRTHRPVEVQGFALGEFAIVTNPAELFCEFGTRIREQSPFGVTMPVELANDACGYVPYARSFEHGGYETHRTCWTSRLVPEAGEMVAERSLELLNRLRG